MRYGRGHPVAAARTTCGDKMIHLRTAVARRVLRPEEAFCENTTDYYDYSMTVVCIAEAARPQQIGRTRASTWRHRSPIPLPNNAVTVYVTPSLHKKKTL